jgi:DNA-binding NarL/FixJ family response regulator
MCTTDWGVTVRSVLVCVRTSLAAQSVASCAARLGVFTLRTAVSEAEVLARLAEQPADLILADTAVTRPDTIGFTRRALSQSPGAVLVLFGAEDPKVAAATVAAGARGVIRGGDNDLVGTVAKALLLIGVRNGTGEAAGPGGGSAALRPAAAAAGATAAGGRGGLPDRAGRARPAVADDGGPALVPTQRGDVVVAEPLRALSRLRAPLTEREQQVLRGMAEGKSNAEIGRDLFVSEDTIKTHARRLFRKLGARDRAHAVAVGFRSGVLP